MTRPAIAIAAALMTALGYVGPTGLAARDDKPWIGYGGSADSSRYFNSKQINQNNVAKLEVVWSYPFGETVFHPLVAHGTVFGRGHSGAIVALDARTGKELWIHDGMQGHDRARNELLGKPR
jgi:glucose dehydrogenase